MKTLNELQPLIVQWAKDRNINLPECAPKQILKLIEECGELASAILKNDVNKQKDAIGDIFVVLVILAEKLTFKYDTDLDLHKKIKYHKKEIYFHLNGIIHSIYCVLEDKNAIGHKYCLAGLNEISEILNLDLTECANIAWNEIKDRKGKTVNNVFIKD